MGLDVYISVFLVQEGCQCLKTTQETSCGLQRLRYSERDTHVLSGTIYLYLSELNMIKPSSALSCHIISTQLTSQNMLCESFYLLKKDGALYMLAGVSTGLSTHMLGLMGYNFLRQGQINHCTETRNWVSGAAGYSQPSCLLHRPLDESYNKMCCPKFLVSLRSHSHHIESLSDSSFMEMKVSQLDFRHPYNFV